MNIGYSRKILLIGANDKSMLSMAKQCHQLNLTVDCVDILDYRFNYSRYVNSYFQLPDFRQGAQQFVSALLELNARKEYDAAIIIHDDMLELYMQNKLLIDASLNIICPPTASQYELSHNKYSLITFCAKLGFKYPETHLIESLADLNHIIPKLKFPLIAKPVSTSTLVDNHLVTLSVKKIDDVESLIDYVREHINNIPIMLQELVTGYGAGVNFLAENGKVLQQYIHLREREAFNGGVSSLRKVIGTDHLSLFKHLERFVQETNWSGLGMLEFKINNQTPYLMELNGRPWGSMEAGVIAGYNIPGNFISTFYTKTKTESSNINHETVFVLNSKLDLQYSLKEAVRTKGIYPVIRWMYDVSLNPKIKVEDSLQRDFAFNLYNLFTVLATAVKKQTKKIQLKKIPVINSMNLKKGQTVGYVCLGNICRSPFAHVYSESEFASYKFTSFGISTEPNRLPPFNAVLAAKESGININHHKSSVLDEFACQSSDVLIFMDTASYNLASNTFGKYKNKMYKMTREDIPDPFGQNLEYFIKSYNLIKESVKELFS